VFSGRLCYYKNIGERWHVMTTVKKQYVGHVISWTESERGWGQKPYGYTLHATPEDAHAHIAAHWAKERAFNRKHGIIGTPEWYVRPDSDRPVMTTITSAAAKRLRKAVKAGKTGIHFDRPASLNF